ncbi:tetratricopeptide repeat protein [Bacillus sp. FSL M7-1345]
MMRKAIQNWRDGFIADDTLESQFYKTLNKSTFTAAKALVERYGYEKLKETSFKRFRADLKKQIIAEAHSIGYEEANSELYSRVVDRQTYSIFGAVAFILAKIEIEMEIEVKNKMNSLSNRFPTHFRPGDRVNLQFLDSSQQSNDYVPLLDLGVSYKRRGLYEQAKEQYIKAIKVNPKHFQAYYNLGKVLYILGEYKPAVNSYKTALELGYDRIGDVMRHIGHALIDKKASKAEEHIVMNYLQSIDPFNKLAHKKPTNKEINDYDAQCALVAKQYIKSSLAEE